MTDVSTMAPRYWMQEGPRSPSAETSVRSGSAAAPGQLSHVIATSRSRRAGGLTCGRRRGCDPGGPPAGVPRTRTWCCPVCCARPCPRQISTRWCATCPDDSWPGSGTTAPGCSGSSSAPTCGSTSSCSATTCCAGSKGSTRGAPRSACAAGDRQPPDAGAPLDVEADGRLRSRLADRSRPTPSLRHPPGRGLGGPDRAGLIGAHPSRASGGSRCVIASPERRR